MGGWHRRVGDGYGRSAARFRRCVGPLEHESLYATAHEGINWCVKVYHGAVERNYQESVPQDEVDAGIAVDGKSHQPLGFIPEWNAP